MASGEHQPCTRCAASSAGSAAERLFGYFAMCSRISRSSSGGTSTDERSGIVAGGFVRSAGSSQSPATDGMAVS
jgi:hypothetical protein